MSDDEYPEDETDLTSEQMDALMERGEEVELVPPPVQLPLRPGQYLRFDFTRGCVDVIDGYLNTNARGGF